MGTRYSDEEIGVITDEEVIFKSGERYQLKEISKAEEAENGVSTFCGVVVSFGLFVGFIVLVAYNSLAGFLYIPIAIWLFVKAFKAFYFRTITLYAKNGESMFTFDAPKTTESIRFVEQLNRYIG